MLKTIKRVSILFLASVLMAVNINTFVHTGGLFPGGATGLTVLAQKTALRYWGLHLPYTFINILLNAIPVYIGFRFIGKKFTGYSLLMIMMTNLLTDILPTYVITYDTLLISIFGGLVNGTVISLCLMEHATTGGTDFIGIYLAKKRGTDSWNVTLGINAVILLTAGYLFGWDKALYSIIFQYVSTQVLHFMYRNYQQETLLIVTEKPEEVAKAIHVITQHGATMMHGEGAFEHKDRPIVYSVIARSDHQKVMEAVREIDEAAFVNAIRTERLQGRFNLQNYE